MPASTSYRAAAVEVDAIAELVLWLLDTGAVTDDPVAVLAAIEWMAPTFEVVRCPYPGWRFGIAAENGALGLEPLTLAII
jgi:hypothetical protein